MDLKKMPGSPLQYCFTSYLQKAVKRKWADYNKRLQLQVRTVPFPEESDFADEPDLLSTLPLEEQLGNALLYRALLKIHEREKQILFLRVLEKMSFADIAAELGVSVPIVKNTYYRLLKKLKKEMGGGNNGF